MSDDDILGLHETPPPDDPERPKESRQARIPQALGTLFFSVGFGLVVGLVIGAFQIAGVISMGLAHMLIILAWVIAAVAIWAWLLSSTRKHKTKTGFAMVLAMGIVLFAADRWMVSKRAELDRAAAQSQTISTPTPAVTPSPSFPPVAVSPTEIPLSGPFNPFGKTVKVKGEIKIYNRTDEPYYQIWVKIILDSDLIKIEQIILSSPTIEAERIPGQIPSEFSDKAFCLRGQGEDGRKAYICFVRELNPKSVFTFAVANDYPGKLPQAQTHKLLVEVLRYAKEPALVYSGDRSGAVKFNPPEIFTSDAIINFTR